MKRVKWDGSLAKERQERRGKKELDSCAFDGLQFYKERFLCVLVAWKYTELRCESERGIKELPFFYFCFCLSPILLRLRTSSLLEQQLYVRPSFVSILRIA